MNKVYDIAIIGLGPAGSTLARLLDKRFNIVAFDKKDKESGGFQKPCGGLLAPDAQKAAAGLGLTLPKEILAEPQIFAVRTMDLKSGLERHYQRFYMNLDRNKLDLWLMSLIPENVDIIAPATCVSVTRECEVFEIRYIKGGAEEIAYAKYAIGADGANSKLRRFLYPKVMPKRYAALQQWFRAPDMAPLYTCVFDPSITDCYCWGVSKDGFFILGGAFPSEHAKERYEVLRKKLSERGFSLENPVKTEGCLVLCPRVTDVRTGGKNAFLIGEAAGFISPSSLEGISWAFDSARILAETLNSQDEAGRRYFTATLKLRFKILVKSVKAFLIYNSFTRSLIMRSGIQKIDMYNRKD